MKDVNLSYKNVSAKYSLVYISVKSNFIIKTNWKTAEMNLRSAYPYSPRKHSKIIFQSKQTEPQNIMYQREMNLNKY